MDRPLEPLRRLAMTEAAVALLEEKGPSAMTARKVTAKVGASSMAVYTQFGSMRELVASVVDYGFGLLRTELDALTMSDDPAADLWLSAQTLREFALSHRHLYAVMFAAESIGGHERSGPELEQGKDTLRFLYQLCKRAIDTGHFTVGTARTATHQLWIAMHGHLMLELAGYMALEEDRLQSFAQTITTVSVGLGAQHDAVKAGVAVAL